MGYIHSNYSSFMRKGILIMPYISVMTKKNSNESLKSIYIFHLTDNCGCHSDMVTDIHRWSQARIGVLVNRIGQNSKVTHTQE